MRHLRFWDGLITQRTAPKEQCATMSEVCTQWRFPKRRPGTVAPPSKPVHDIYSHLGDCLKMYAWEKEIPDARMSPVDAGRVALKHGNDIIDQPYKSPFRSR